jgi:purine-nucleoside phosphorylase
VQEPTHIEAQAAEAAAYLKATMPFRVRTGIILGSGLGIVRRAFETVHTVPYEKIPHFPVSTVQGHSGRLVLGKLGRKHIFIMEGRVHRYEGYPYRLVTFPVRVLRRLGVGLMIISNAAGAVSKRFKPGDIMLIEDHIDLMWKGVPGISKGPQAVHKPYYSSRLLDIAAEVAVAEGVKAGRGVLIARTGPSYETVSEVDFSRKVGADAATMSTIPEVTLCRQLGIAVLGLSVITNVAGTHGGGHEAVIDFAEKGSRDLRRLILGVLDRV